MTLEELNNILKETGYPVAYSHFKQRQTLPFITYLVEGTSNFFADDKVLLKVEQINIELYTSKKDLEAEKIILNDFNFIPIFYKSEYEIMSSGNNDILYDPFTKQLFFRKAKYVE